MAAVKGIDVHVHVATGEVARHATAQLGQPCASRTLAEDYVGLETV